MSDSKHQGQTGYLQLDGRQGGKVLLFKVVAVGLGPAIHFFLALLEARRYIGLDCSQSFAMYSSAARTATLAFLQDSQASTLLPMSVSFRFIWTL